MERDLTERTVSTLKVPTGSRDVWAFDRTLKGFGIRKFDTGRASYFVKYTIAGKRRHKTLGPVVGNKLSDMRARAANVIAEALAGRDAIAEKKAAASAKPTLILSELIEKYLADRKPKLRPRYVSELTRQLRRDWKPLHNRAVKEITRQDVVLTIDDIATGYGNTTADRAKAALSACFTWAIERSILDATPVLNIKARTNNERDRVLTEAELRLVWRCCLDDDYGRIIRLLVLTGQRRTEIGSLAWCEVNLADKQLEFPSERMKNARGHLVPLSDEAMALLPKQRVGHDHLFGFRAGSGFSGWGKAKRQLDQRITAARHGKPLAPWVLHDLRRTCATGLQKLGIRLEVTEAVLGHVGGSRAGVVGIYQRHAYADEKRAALAGWGAYVGSLVGDTPKVVRPALVVV